MHRCHKSSSQGSKEICDEKSVGNDLRLEGQHVSDIERKNICYSNPNNLQSRARITAADFITLSPKHPSLYIQV